ncbi:unnamed protein product [Gordionus sp. m RMFG-2023]
MATEEAQKLSLLLLETNEFKFWGSSPKEIKDDETSSDDLELTDITTLLPTLPTFKNRGILKKAHKDCATDAEYKMKKNNGKNLSEGCNQQKDLHVKFIGLDKKLQEPQVKRKKKFPKEKFVTKFFW